MDITLTEVNTVSFIQHKPYDGIENQRYCNTLTIYTDKGQVSLSLFGDKPLTIQLGDKE